MSLRDKKSMTFSYVLQGIQLGYSNVLWGSNSNFPTGVSDLFKCPPGNSACVFRCLLGVSFKFSDEHPDLFMSPREKMSRVG